MLSEDSARKGRALNYFDLHCDTAYRMYKEEQPLDHNTFHISLEKAEKFNKYAQIMAICAPTKSTDDDSYTFFHKATDNLMRGLDRLECHAAFCADSYDLDAALNCGKKAFFLSVEDARILNNDIRRLYVLHARKVRILTLLWSGETCIGGSHNTDLGLSDFGKKVVSECFNIGIIPDISHASEKSADDVIDLAYANQKPIIASHSNSFAVYPHSRNLRERHLKAICELSGLVGISMCRIHLCDTSIQNATVDTVLRHIDYYLSHGAEDVLAFGCDLDGTDLPVDISNISYIDKIANALAKNGMSDRLINKIYFENAYNFIKKNLIPAKSQYYNM